MTSQLFDRRSILAMTMGAALAPTSLALAQTVSRPVKILVGFAAGGSIDTVARLLAENLKPYAASVIVENRGGASGRIALEALKRSDPDGSVIAISPGDQITLFPEIYKSLTYSPLRDFLPVSTVCSFPFVVVVGPMVPASVQNLTDFITWCRANPERSSFGSPGAGTRQHLIGTTIAADANISLTHVPFSGAAPALNAVLGGQIPATVSVLASALPQVQSGTLRAIAITSPQRNPLLPEIATVRETGFASAEGVEWFGVFLPAATPQRFASELGSTVESALSTAQMQTALAKQAFSPEAIRDQKFKDLIQKDSDHWRRVVTASGFKPID